jgi:hypothetical protein
LKLKRFSEKESRSFDKTERRKGRHIDERPSFSLENKHNSRG